MDINSLISFIAGLFPWGYLKFAILILLGFYSVFAAIIVRQEQLMSRVVNISVSTPILKTIALLHFIASVMVFFLALVSL